MEPAEFRRVMGIGLGRSILHLQGGSYLPSYRDAILECSIHNTAYDPQVEGSRAPYMLDIINLTGERSLFEERTIEALLKPAEFWDLNQLFGLALEFARQGSQHARSAMYERYRQMVYAEHPSDVVGEEQMIALDGVQGLLLVAEVWGARVRRYGDWADDYPVTLAEESCGSEVVAAALQEAAAGNPDIAAYRDALVAQKGQPRSEQVTLSGLSYGEIKRRLDARDRTARTAMVDRWARQADDGDLEAAARDLQIEQDEDRLEQYLWMFQTRRFPLSPARLMELVESGSESLSWRATRALQPLSSPELRDFALRQLRTRGRADVGMALLANHYQLGDEQLIDGVLPYSDPDELHRPASYALDILEEHPSIAAEPVLLKIYECGACSRCRGRALTLLTSLGKLPPALLNEANWDSNLETREWARELLGN